MRQSAARAAATSSPGPGRPPGSRSVTPHERILRNLPKIYEASLRSALAGDADSARLCLDIAAHPDQFPQVQRNSSE